MFTSISTLVASALILGGTTFAAPAPNAGGPSANSTSSYSSYSPCKSTHPSTTAIPGYNNKAVTTTTSPAAPTPTAPSTSPNGLTLYQQLVLAPNAVERTKLLSKDEDFLYDFKTTTIGIAKGEGGSVVRADHATFPALVGSGGAVAIGFLGPCGFNTPHVHPRAAELNLVVQGHLVSQSIHENGNRVINHNLSQWQMTVFPQGAVHTEFNPDCTDSVFIASFPSEDPGVGQIAQEYFGLSNEIVKGSAGGEVTIDGANIDAFRSKIPDNVAKGVDSCLIKCGIKKRSAAYNINAIMEGRDVTSE
ncbi:spherulin-1B [Halenospora varia]|nr:spherulin-1B [Halenospora varia]